MANPVNDRDLLLQGATSRVVDVTLPANIVPPALKAIALSMPSTTFRMATDGTPSPSAIVITANLRAIPGAPTMTWTVTPAGAATLTGSTYGVRTLAFANLAQDYCTVRVEVNIGGMIYFDEVSFAKVRDGAAGAPGRRGSISTARAVTSSTWSDTQAAQALTDLGISTPLATDTVTLYNASTSYSEMRRYDGTAWVAVPASLPGSALMDGTLGLTKFASGLEPVKIVATLPGSKVSSTVFLTSDNKVYRWNGTAYTKDVDAADIVANSITAGQIQAGAIKTDELDALAVTTAKLAAGAVTADKITAGAITTEKLLVTGLGIAINPDPNTQDISAWTGTGLSIVADTTSPSGNSALECAGLAATVLSKKFPIDPTKNYKARLWTKQQSGSSTSYGAVAFYDASGAVISGSSNGAGWPGRDAFHYFGLVNGALPAAWTEYSISFGPGEGAVLPSNARFMAIGVLSNYTGSGVQRVAAALVHIKTTGDMVVNGSITADKVDTRGLSIKDASGNVILAAGNTLPSSYMSPTVPIPDTRSVNAAPSSYSVGKTTEFKSTSAIGLSSSANYCSLETIKAWNDSSGGEAVQWACVTSGEVWKRSAGNGATSWGAWVRDIDRSVYTGALDANKTTDTNQLTDGAGLGTKAVWSNVDQRPTDISNLIKKGVFDDGQPGSWGYAGIENRINSGMPYAKNIYFHGRDSLENNEGFPVTPGETLFAAAWLETLGISSYSGSLGVRVSNASGTVIAFLGLCSIAPNTAWTYASGSGVIPAGGVLAHPWVQMDGWDFPANYQWLRAAGLWIGRHAPGATVGAAFGVNISGQITPANASTYIASAAIGAAHIADAAITQAKIGSAAVGSAQIAAAAIGTAHIGSAAIGSAQIASAAITNAKIGSAAVDTLQIAGNAVTVSNSSVGMNPSTTLYIPANETLTVVALATCPSVAISTGGSYYSSPYLTVTIDGETSSVYQGAAVYAGDSGSSIYAPATTVSLRKVVSGGASGRTITISSTQTQNTTTTLIALGNKR